MLAVSCGWLAEKLYVAFAVQLEPPTARLVRKYHQCFCDVDNVENSRRECRGRALKERRNIRWGGREDTFCAKLFDLIINFPSPTRWSSIHFFTNRILICRQHPVHQRNLESHIIGHYYICIICTAYSPQQVSRPRSPPLPLVLA